MTKRRAWIVLGFALSGLAICLVAALVLVGWWQLTTSCYNHRPPLSSFDLTLDRSRQLQLIEQSQRFAETNGFRFQIVYYNPDHSDFLIDMTRTDVEILEGSNGLDLDSYLITFHNNDCIHPTVLADIKSLVNNFRGALAKIPGAAISEIR